MAALVFPPNPAVDEQFVGPYGEVYTWDGTRWTLTASANVPGTPISITFSCAGAPLAAGQLVVPVSFPLTVPANLAGSLGNAVEPPTAAVSMALIDGASTVIGTIDVDPTGAFAFSGPGANFAAGDVISLLFPDPQDASFANFGVTIAATRA